MSDGCATRYYIDMNINEMTDAQLLNSSVKGAMDEAGRRGFMVSPSGKTFRRGNAEQSARWARAGWMVCAG